MAATEPRANRPARPNDAAAAAPPPADGAPVAAPVAAARLMPGGAARPAATPSPDAAPAVTLSEPRPRYRATPELALAVSEFLYYEAALLDAGDLAGWLALYADDAVYWVPAHARADAARDVSIAYDDRRRLEERVHRLTSGFAWAQSPPSRTVHVVGNVRVLGEQDGALTVASNLVVAEVRRGGQRVYAGQVTHELVPHADTWRIRRKTIHLVNSEVPLGNLTFIL